MHEEEQVERDQHEQVVSPNVCPERREVPETDTSPAKTLTVLQGTCTSEQTVSRSAVDVSDLTSRGDDGVVVVEY